MGGYIQGSIMENTRWEALAAERPAHAFESDGRAWLVLGADPTSTISTGMNLNEHSTVKIVVSPAPVGRIA